MNIVYIGEAGSGKTELSINTAVTMAADYHGGIVLIDLDQTKAFFRLREQADKLENMDISVKWGEQLLDTPIAPSGVREAVLDDDVLCIIDVGGNVPGAVQLGQYAEELNSTQTEVYYCVNPYRPFSSADEISIRMDKIMGVSGIKGMKLLCNPNLGADTSADDIREGIMMMEETARDLGRTIDKVAVFEDFYDEIAALTEYDIVILRRYVKMFS